MLHWLKTLFNPEVTPESVRARLAKANAISIASTILRVGRDGQVL